ncbi:MAG TPA: acyl carrier protein [Gemmatimonadaceae bacterium]
MTTDELRATILAALRRIAPEVDAAKLDAGLPLRDQVDLDSMDFLTFLMEVHRLLGVDIPERDYAQVATLDGLEAYVRPRVSTPSPTSIADR